MTAITIPDPELSAILQQARQLAASDIHLTPGQPPLLRIHGILQPLSGSRILSSADTEAFMALSSQRQGSTRHRMPWERDFSFAVPGAGRFRASVFRQRGQTSAVLRAISLKIPTLAELGHPPQIAALAALRNGLLLIAGAAGSGKSTTLAALLHHINTSRSCHIITVEDPVEYLHTHGTAIIHQRELHKDTASFADALRAALREDPDVIAVGELRDPAAVSAALSAAETGHFVLATIHAGNTLQAAERIIDVFPAARQAQVRNQLAAVLQGIVFQQLLPRLDRPERVAALEILLATPAVRHLIRENKAPQLYNIIQTGSKLGMQTLEHSIASLASQGVIAAATDTAGFGGGSTASLWESAHAHL